MRRLTCLLGASIRIGALMPRYNLAKLYPIIGVLVESQRFYFLTPRSLLSSESSLSCQYSAHDQLHFVVEVVYMSTE